VFLCVKTAVFIQTLEISVNKKKIRTRIFHYNYF